MEVADDTDDKIELLTDSIIYVERPGRRTERELADLFEQGRKIAAQLRIEGKPVLILNQAHDMGVNPHILTLLLSFDFDRLAVYGTAKRLNNRRDLMARANGLESKIASFGSEEEALAWLHAF